MSVILLKLNITVMDKEKHIGGSKLLEQEIRKYKLLIKEGSLGRKHFDPDFIRKWDAVADNAVFINELQQIINQYQQAIVDGIAFYGDKNTIKPEGTVVNLSVRLFNLPQTGWTNWRFYKNGEFVRNYTIPQGEFNTHNGVYTFLTETVNEDTLYKIEVYQLNGEPYTYTGVWQVSTTNWKANTDEVWDNYFEKTQAEINREVLRLSLSVTLDMTGVGTRVERGTVGTPVLGVVSSSNRAALKLYRRVSGSSDVLLASGNESIEYSDTNRTFNVNNTYFATATLGDINKESNHVVVTVYDPVVYSHFYWGLVSGEDYNTQDLEEMVYWLENEEEIVNNVISNKNIEITISGNEDVESNWRYVVLAIPSGVSVRNFYMNNIFEWDDIRLIGSVTKSGVVYNVYSTSAPGRPSSFTLTINKS